MCFLDQTDLLCFSPRKWNCSPHGPLPLFMLAEISGHWQAKLDSQWESSKGRKGTLWPSVLSLQFRMLGWRQVWKHLSLCKVSVPSWWKIPSWPQEHSPLKYSVHLTTLLDALFCPYYLMKQRLDGLLNAVYKACAGTEMSQASKCSDKF